MNKKILFLKIPTRENGLPKMEAKVANEMGEDVESKLNEDWIVIKSPFEPIIIRNNNKKILYLKTLVKDGALEISEDAKDRMAEKIQKQLDDSGEDWTVIISALEPIIISN